MERIGKERKGEKERRGEERRRGDGRGGEGRQRMRNGEWSEEEGAGKEEQNRRGRE